LGGGAGRVVSLGSIYVTLLVLEYKRDFRMRFI
jgi:hypothetical protein